MVSPLCQVSNAGAAYVTSVGGVNVTAAATIVIRLADTNVDTWSIQCVSTDDANVAAAIQAALTIDSLNKTATFTAPAAGAALRFRSVVNGGIDGNGVTQSSYSTTFCIYTLVSGYRTIAADETTEGGTFGWLSSLNSILRVGITGFVPPTGTGVWTGTSGAGDAAAKPVGAGFYTWIATPSSANLAALVTDETGSGSLVFGTSPLFKTTINLNNPADTFKYVITPAAIAADRILNLPLLAATDTVAVLAFAQTFTNKTIVAASNTITDTSAALGDLFRFDGTRFARFARGATNTVLTGTATDVAWTDPQLVTAASRLTALDANHLHAWEMNDASGSLIDTGSSVSKVNLPITGTPFYSIPGLLGNCMLFGIDATGAASTPYASALSSAFSDLPTGACTIEAWVSHYDLSVAGHILGVATNGSTRFVINKSNAANTYDVSANTGATAAFLSGTSNVRTTFTGPWHHVMYVFSPGGSSNTGLLTLYIDGEIAYAATNSAGGAQGGITWTTGTTPTFFIGGNSFTSNSLQGKISRCRLSNIARSQSYARTLWAKAMGY